MASKRKKNYKSSGKKQVPQKQQATTPNKRKNVKAELATPSGLRALDRFVEKRALLLLVLLMVSTGLFVFWDYFTLKYVYFFKDIGSDVLNGTYPSYLLMAKTMQSEGWVSFWTFSKGMGQSYFNSLPTEPFRLIFGGIDYLFIRVWGADYLVYTNFHRTFFHFSPFCPKGDRCILKGRYPIV